MDFKNVNPNIAAFIDTLNAEGLELVEMFSEYQDIDKNLKAAKAVEYFILNGPYAKSIAHRFTSDTSLEEFLNMVYDTQECCRSEHEFIDNALELFYDEFDIQKSSSGKIVQPEDYKVGITTSDLIKVSVKSKIPLQIIRDEYMIKTPISGSDPTRTLLRDGNYSYFFFNKALKSYMNTYLPKLAATNKVEFAISEKTFDEEDNFYCTVSIALPPSRVNFDTIDEFHKLIDYIVNEYKK